MPRPQAAPPRCADRAGFTFIELIVGLAIMVMLAVVITPVLSGTLDRARVDQARNSLAGLVDAVQSFRSDVGSTREEYPSHLTQLSGPIAGSDRNLCDETYSSKDVSRWEGPYLDRLVPATGLPVGIGTARNQLVRSGSGGSALLRIVVEGVSQADAGSMDREVDGGDGAASGTVRWGAVNSEGIVALDYVVPMRCGIRSSDDDDDDDDDDD